MHGAKGLEWRAVLCIRMNEDECPIGGAAGDALEEERRLAYVGLSRAKERLFLSHVMADSAGQPSMPSRFIRELPVELVTHHTSYQAPVGSISGQLRR